MSKDYIPFDSEEEAYDAMFKKAKILKKMGLVGKVSLRVQKIKGVWFVVVKHK